jgi:hypothetical protein
VATGCGAAKNPSGEPADPPPGSRTAMPFTLTDVENHLGVTTGQGLHDHRHQEG